MRVPAGLLGLSLTLLPLVATACGGPAFPRTGDGAGEPAEATGAPDPDPVSLPDPAGCPGLCVPAAVQDRFDAVQDAHSACVAAEEEDFSLDNADGWLLADVALGERLDDDQLEVLVTAANIESTGWYHYPAITLDVGEVHHNNQMYGYAGCDILTARFVVHAPVGQKVTITPATTSGFETVIDTLSLTFEAP